MSGWLKQDCLQATCPAGSSSKLKELRVYKIVKLNIVTIFLEFVSKQKLYFVPRL